MARITKHGPYREFALDSTVGVGRASRRDDIIVVQALLRNVMEYKTGFFSGAIAPMVTGTMDRITGKAIKQYQRYLRRRVGAHVSVDGRIDPVKGAYVRKGSTLMWTLHQLMNDAAEIHLMDDREGADWVDGICIKYPLVAAVVAGGVGTLGLALE